MVDIMVLIDALLTLIKLGSFGPAWYPKWIGSHLWNHKFSNTAEFAAAVELIAGELSISQQEAEKLIFDYACGKHGM